MIRALMREALAEERHAREVMVHPYSSHDALVKFYISRGVCQGIGRVLDAWEK